MAGNDLSDLKVRDVPVSAEIVSEDIKAKSESADIVLANLKAESKKKQRGRDESAKDAIHGAGIFVFWCVVCALLVFGVSWVAHIVLPQKYHWLESGQLETIQVIIFSSLASIAASNYARRYLG